MSDWLQIHGLVDGELCPEEKAIAEERLKTCVKSQAEYEAVQALKETLRSKCSVEDESEVWSKCKARLDEIDRVKRVEGFVGRYAWVLCCLFFFTILVGSSVSRTKGPRIYSGDVVRASSGFTPLPQPSSQAANEQQRWVRGIFDGVEPVKTRDLTLVGGAKGFLNGLPVTRLDLADNKGALALFVILGDKSLEEAGVSESHYVGISVPPSRGIAWSEHGRTFLLISERDTNSLIKSADAIRGR